MCKYKYSPSMQGFYHTDVHGENIPEDTVEITDDEHAALMEAQSQGKIIQPGPDGKPVAVDPPPPAPPTVQNIKSEAARRLAPTDWIVIRQAEGGKAIPDGIAAYRAAVRAASDRIEALDPIPDDYADDHRWPTKPAHTDQEA